MKAQFPAVAPPIPAAKPQAGAGAASGAASSPSSFAGSSFQDALQQQTGVAVSPPPIPAAKPAIPAARNGIGGASSSAVTQLIEATQHVAGLSGHSARSLLAQASVESRLNPQARNRNSSAAGPFQFLERTWLDMVRRHGTAYGLGDMAKAITVRQGVPSVADPRMRQQILDLRHDINLSAGMAGRYMAENRAVLGKMLKRPVSETESRIAYVLGVGGAARLIRTAESHPQSAAAELMPNAAKANSSLFFDKSGRPFSVAETLATMKRRMERDFQEMFASMPSTPTNTAIEYDGLTPHQSESSNAA